MRVLRHALVITDKQLLTLPAYGYPISVAPSRVPALANVGFDLWSIDRQNPRDLTSTMDIEVYAIGTGNEMPAELSSDPESMFLGTILTPSNLVWHIFWKYEDE